MKWFYHSRMTQKDDFRISPNCASIGASPFNRRLKSSPGALSDFEHAEDWRTDERAPDNVACKNSPKIHSCLIHQPNHYIIMTLKCTKSPRKRKLVIDQNSKNSENEIRTQIQTEFQILQSLIPDIANRTDISEVGFQHRKLQFYAWKLTHIFISTAWNNRRMCWVHRESTESTVTPLVFQTRP